MFFSNEAYILVSAISKTLIWLLFLGGSKKDYCSCIVHFGPFFGREDCLRQNHNIWDSRRNHLFYNICKKTGEIVVAALRRGEKFEEDMGWRWWKNKKSRFENVHPFLPNFFIIVKHANFKVKTSSLTTKKIFVCVCVWVVGSWGSYTITSLRWRILNFFSCKIFKGL